MKRQCHFKKGMTLVEILIVTSLISLISVVLYHALSNGLRVWGVSQKVVIEEDTALFLEKLSSDLHNTLFYAKLPFLGDHETLSFPTMIKLKEEDAFSQSPKVSEQIGRVQYSYDVSHKTIIRKEADYGQAINNEYGYAQTFVTQVDSLRFNYIYVTEKEQILSENILETMPSAVEVEVTFFENKLKRSIKKTIDIPLAG
jgi:prepilin-type N-terminal cleavage/methylation domain-containing protein